MIDQAKIDSAIADIEVAQRELNPKYARLKNNSINNKKILNDIKKLCLIKREINEINRIEDDDDDDYFRHLVVKAMNYCGAGLTVRPSTFAQDNEFKIFGREFDITFE